jgi:hypothetical protein
MIVPGICTVQLNMTTGLLHATTTLQPWHGSPGTVV